MTGLLIPNGKQTFFDQYGVPLAGGTVTFLIPSTTTAKDTYQDIGLTILNSNPVQLDAGGTAIIWGSGSYRQIVADSNGVAIWDQETAVNGSAGTSQPGSGPTFVNPQAGDNMIISSGGVAVALIIGPTSGGYIVNPPDGASQGLSQAENAYVDPVASPGSTNSSGNGTTSILRPGDIYTVPPILAGVTIWGNAPSSGHKLTVVKY